jgi:hypothetical protein
MLMAGGFLKRNKYRVPMIMDSPMGASTGTISSNKEAGISGRKRM